MSTKIKSFEDACKTLGIDAVLPDVSAIAERDGQSLIATYKLTIIARALNEGWVPDWNNMEGKWYPWFDMSGSGLSFFVCDYYFSYSFVGSRLCYKSRDLAKYAGTQFEDLYKQAFEL